MSPRRKKVNNLNDNFNKKGYIEGAGEVVEQKIVSTIKELYALCDECYNV